MGLLWLLLYGGMFALAIGMMLIAVELLRPRRKTFAWALAKGLATDPEQLGWRYEQVKLRFADASETIAWVIDGEVQGGHRVVVCHGWGESKLEVLGRMKPVVQSAGQVVVYDQRGHGEAEAKLCRLGMWEVSDLEAVLRQVRERYGARDLVLLGYSMGAGVVVQYGAKHVDDELKAVVVEGVCPKLRYALAGILWLLHMPPWPMAWVVPWLVMPWAWGVAWRDHRYVADKVQCPLLVLHGQADPIAPVKHARTMAKLAVLGTMVEFADAGHVGLAEADEARYVDALQSVMKKGR